MSITQNLFKKTPSISWMADADPIGAPDGALLRSDNLVPDEIGAIALRKGSATLFSGLGARVHTLKTSILQGTVWRFAGCDNRLSRNGQDFGINFDGSGDMAIGDDSFQAFFARATTKKKFDGTNFNNWGIASPTLAPTLQAFNSVFVTVASFASAESPAFTINEGTSTFVADFNNVANNALQLAPANTGRASASKVFPSDQDFFNIGGGQGADTDLIDIFIYIQEPNKVSSITLMFGLGTGADPFVSDYYYFDFRLPNSPGGANTVDVKDPAAQSASTYAKFSIKYLTTLDPRLVTSAIGPDEAAAILKKIGRFSGPRVRERKDPSQNSPAWTHFSVTRGQFNRISSTNGAGRGWNTVRGFKVVYTALPGSSEVVAFSSAIIMGGGARSLTGSYTCVYRFVRDTGNYIELSPVSPVSASLTLTQQALQVTIPAAALQAADPQVNQVWIYLFGGFLDFYYRFAVTGSTAQTTTMRIDEFAKTAHGTIDATDRTRLVNQGLSIPGFTPNADLIVQILKGEQDAVIENERLEPGPTGPPDNIIAIAGPHLSRMFVCTNTGWVYPSSDTSPSNFSSWWALDLRRWGTPQWMVRTSAGVMVGMTKDIVQITGTGDLSDDLVSIDLYPSAIGVGNAPVDPCVFTDLNAIVYRGSDDLMTMTGISLTPVDQGQVSLLWRGWARHGVAPLNLTGGRFRLTVSQHILFMIAPETPTTDGSPIIWRYGSNKWSRTQYPATFLSINRDPDGTVLAGTNDGRVIQLEQAFQDDQTRLPVNMLTAFADNGNPLARKDGFDLQVHAESDGSIGLLSLYLDDATVAAATFPFAMAGSGIFRVDLANLPVPIPAFFRAQIGITGTFGTLRIRAFNIAYRPRPQQVMAVDTGYIMPQEPKETVWLREVLIDCITPNDLQLVCYANDILKTTIAIPATSPNRREVYRVVFPKGQLKARRPRLLIQTKNANGVGNLGFEPYLVRVLHRQSGDDAPEKPYQTVWPVTQTEFLPRP